MAKMNKYKLEIWIKDADRAIRIINRLWAVGELTRGQRLKMIGKIDSKRVQIEIDKMNKFEQLTAKIRKFYIDSTADSDVPAAGQTTQN